MLQISKYKTIIFFIKMENLSLKELRLIAKNRNISCYKSMPKDKLLEIIINNNNDNNNNNNNNNNKAPNEFSLLGWLMGRAPDTYKMSHKASAIYSL